MKVPRVAPTSPEPDSGRRTRRLPAHGHHVIAAAAMSAAFGSLKPGCGKDSQTSVKMPKADHVKTETHGNVPGFKDAQKLQQNLLEAKDFEGAFARGIADIVSKTGDRYAEGIQEAWAHFDNWLKKAQGPTEKVGREPHD
jgi:hypothetical protein